ncbi:MAG TPA: acyltransferase, partial [Beutenbergiaceae bacterium]|nr:acyltransferase [Beutenbergiaceae bacterium]
MTTTTTHPEPKARSAGPKRRVRKDIQALRALAVVVVLGYHFTPTLVPGGYVGVDIFFVISGFVITSLMIAEVEATGKLNLAKFYARRARRILPAATVTVVATVV